MVPKGSLNYILKHVEYTTDWVIPKRNNGRGKQLTHQDGMGDCSGTEYDSLFVSLLYQVYTEINGT